MQYRKRALQAQIQAALLDTSVIAITGARRAGKKYFDTTAHSKRYQLCFIG
jgi:predicted AAA+ superfamily ATPase